MVLECIRRGLGPTAADIALYFIKNGIPFVTLRPKLPVYQLFPPLPTQLDLTLGRRDFHHTFTPLEFQDYEWRRNEFFIKYPHAHRALRMGGVVAQLAREVLQPTVMNCEPVREVYSDRFYAYPVSGGVVVDDQLTEAEIDFILGCYPVVGRTGKLLLFPMPRYHGHSAQPTRYTMNPILVSSSQCVECVWAQHQSLDP